MEIGEAIGVAVLLDGPEKCWFCTEPPAKDDLKNELDEDPSSVGSPENDLHNDSSKLGTSLGHRPTWMIRVPGAPDAVEVVPGAHHLIPGNASLNKVPQLLKYMKKGEVIDGDIGYDVNARENGIWLPGNYGVREDSAFGMKWGAYSHKDAYARAAMERARAQFHDAHPRYSGNVKRTLRSIADKILVHHPAKCPGCEKKITDKARPPYGLVGRLNGVSRRHRTFLAGPVRKWPLGAGYFTSSRSAIMKVG